MIGAPSGVCGQKTGARVESHQAAPIAGNCQQGKAHPKRVRPKLQAPGRPNPRCPALRQTPRNRARISPDQIVAAPGTTITAGANRRIRTDCSSVCARPLLSCKVGERKNRRTPKINRGAEAQAEVVSSKTVRLDRPMRNTRCGAAPHLSVAPGMQSSRAQSGRGASTPGGRKARRLAANRKAVTVIVSRPPPAARLFVADTPACRRNKVPEPLGDGAKAGAKQMMRPPNIMNCPAARKETRFLLSRRARSQRPRPRTVPTLIFPAIKASNGRK